MKRAKSVQIDFDFMPFLGAKLNQNGAKKGKKVQKLGPKQAQNRSNTGQKGQEKGPKQDQKGLKRV